jgi:glyoxylase-like metal-dependent hydrolase (beta-lactamase superfamily II)
MNRLLIHPIVSMPFSENTYVVRREVVRDVLVIDPGMEPELILDYLNGGGYKVEAILNTHGHGDHIAGNQAVKEAFPAAPLLIGVNDAIMLSDPVANLSSPFGVEIVSPPADQLLSEGDRLDFAGIPLEVLDIPGHSPGHVVFVFRGDPIVIFGGDVLFRGSIGRTDFPGGSLEQLTSGIRRKLYTLPDDTVIYPGHGEATTVGREKQTNPFVPG